MTRLLFLPGTSQVGSVNWRLASAAAGLARREFEARVSVTCMDLTELDLPHHGGVSEDGASTGIAMLRDAFQRADGLFVTSDEYTGTYSAILKNALAWLKRGEDGKEAVLSGMVVALCGATIGGVRALRGQPALQQLLGELGADVISQHLSPGTSPDPFDSEGRLLPRIERQLLGGCLTELLARASARADLKARAELPPN